MFNCLIIQDVSGIIKHIKSTLGARPPKAAVAQQEHTIHLYQELFVLGGISAACATVINRQPVHSTRWRCGSVPAAHLSLVSSVFTFLHPDMQLHPDMHFVCFLCRFMCSHFHSECHIFASVGFLMKSVLFFLFELDCKYLSICTVDEHCTYVCVLDMTGV